MFTGVQFTHFIQANPALAVFLTIALGFLLGKLRIRSFSLGTVTSVLLVGVIVGQLRIEIPEPAKTLFFLMFLFAVGYAVGPQFFRIVGGQRPFAEGEPFPHVAEEDRSGNAEPADHLEDVEAIPQIHGWLIPVLFLHIILSA